MQHILPVLIVILVLFSVYRRIRRTFGFQKLVKGTMLFRIALFTFIGIMLLVSSYLHPFLYVTDAIGIILGALTAYYAIRTTSFEQRQRTWFYRPNPWIGALLLVLFLGRISYRLFLVYSLLGTSASVKGTLASQPQMATYSNDPFTTLILFLMISYYLVYYIFLIRREGQLKQTEINTLS